MSDTEYSRQQPATLDGPRSTPPQTAERELDRAVTDSVGALQSFAMEGGRIDDTATQAYIASTVQLRGVAATANARIADIRAKAAAGEPGYTPDYVDQAIAKARQDAEAKISNLLAAANAQAQVLEAALIAKALPKPTDNPSVRALLRDDMRAALAGAQGDELVTRALALVGRNSEIDAELLTHGQWLFEGQGRGDLWPTFRSAALGKIAQQRPNDVGIKALASFRSRKVAARAGVLAAAARLQLSQGGR